MYRQILLASLGKVDLVEQAVVAVPVKYFSETKGVKFENDCDDLDFYEGAFFILDDNTPFALIHYRGNPENSIAIYLDRQLMGYDLRRIVENILEAFGIPRTSITWIHGA